MTEPVEPVSVQAFTQQAVEDYLAQVAAEHGQLQDAIEEAHARTTRAHRLLERLGALEAAAGRVLVAATARRRRRGVVDAAQPSLFDQAAPGRRLTAVPSPLDEPVSDSDLDLDPEAVPEPAAEAEAHAAGGVVWHA